MVNTEETRPQTPRKRLGAAEREVVTRRRRRDGAVDAQLGRELLPVGGECRGILRLAVQVAEVRGWKMSEEQNVEAPKMLAKNGLKVEPMTPQFRGELKKIGDTMLKEWLDKAGPEGQALVDGYKKM